MYAVNGYHVGLIDYYYYDDYDYDYDYYYYDYYYYIVEDSTVCYILIKLHRAQTITCEPWSKKN